jgi:nucleoside-diphosphate-sugar epimerase
LETAFQDTLNQLDYLATNEPDVPVPAVVYCAGIRLGSEERNDGPTMGHGVIFVTGASGLLGSNVCQLAVQQGRRVKALVRSESDADVIRLMGAEPVIGDITDIESLDAGMAGSTCVIHCAALIGGSWSTASREDFERVNYFGSMNVLSAASSNRIERTVLISSLVVFDPTQTVTERSAMLPLSTHLSGYPRTKLAIYYEGMRRAACGEDVLFVMPGAIYGPSAFVDRALQPSLFTGTLRAAIAGQLTEYVKFPLTWPFVEDVADVVLSAVDKGKTGASYLGAGRPEDELSLAEFCNLGCEIAGVQHRVRDLSLADMHDDIGSMRAMAARTYPSPLIDPSRTVRDLGVVFTPVRTGIERTVAWLQDQNRI